MIAFTICSNNYLGKAQVLAASIKKRSDAPVFLVLADDKSPEVDYASLGFDRVVEASELPISNLQWMKEQYSIVEFNTALKSFAFQYLMQHTHHNTLYYFDPDMKVYEPLESFAEYWKDRSVVLTPHILSPIPNDGKFPAENLFLSHGTYNLGFIGIRRTPVGVQFLEWWSERLRNHCVIDLRNGYFVDQLWCNLIPVFYPGEVEVCLHPGWNMAYWNLHERKVERGAEGFVVNGVAPLFFYHFSSFDMNLEKVLPVTENVRYRFSELPGLRELFQDYKEDIIRFDPERFKALSYFGGQYPVPVQHPKLPRRIFRKMKHYLNR